MWKTICTADGVYLLQYQTKEKIFTFYLTDLTSIWEKEISENLMTTNFQEYNPTLDIKVEDTTGEILSVLENLDKAEIIIQKDESTATMSISNIISLPDSHLDQILKLELDRVEQKKFTDLVTVPMIQTIYFLEKQQEMLCNLLKKKDLELEQYRLEKELISRTDLITEKFDENILNTSSKKLTLNVFGKAEKFMTKFSQSFGEIEEKVEEVSVEPWNQVKKKRKIFNSATATKKKRKNILRF